MLPTRFWAEMAWPDFQRADMRAGRRRPAARRDRAARPTSPGRRRRGDQRRPRPPRRATAARGPAGPVPAGADGRRLGRARRVSGDADDLGRDGDSGVDGDRRQRSAHRLPQARPDQRPRGQRRGDRGGDAALAHALAHAGGPRLVAAARISRQPVLAPRAGARRPWRLRRDVADARHSPRKRSRLGGPGFPSSAEAIERDFALLRTKPPLGFAWAASDLNPAGAVGEADEATPEKGEAAIAYGVDRFIALLRDVHAFDLQQLRAGPLEREP